MQTNLIYLISISVWLYLIAIITSYALLKFFPALQNTLDKDTTSRMSGIDGLRGFLALGVYIHHTIITINFNNTGKWIPPVDNISNQLGQISVTLFFMITAFLFFDKLYRNHGNINFFQIINGRIFRLYPLYLVFISLLIVFVFFLQDWKINDTVFHILRNYFQWLTFTILGAPDINRFDNTSMLIAHVTWTLKYEWFFYFSLPVLSIVFFRKFNIPQILLSIVFLSIIWKFAFIDIYISMAFLGGIIAVYVVRLKFVTTHMTGTIWNIIALSCIIICLFFFHSSYISFKNPLYSLPLLLLTLFFILILSGNSLFGILKIPAIRWLGEISYSTYLTHGLLLYLFYQYFRADLLKTSFFLSSAIVTIVLVIINSTSFYFIEKHGINIGKIIWVKIDKSTKKNNKS